MIPLLFAGGTFLSTMIGGLFALRWRERMPLLMGFTAGVLLGVVSFDIFPEIIRQAAAGEDPTRPMVAFVAGFLTFHVLEKLLALHHGHEHQYARHKHPQAGVLSALALTAHSFMDGIGMGLGFQVSPAVGYGVAMAVIAHDFSDGINTVTLMLSHRNATRRAFAFLLLDAAAPVLGMLASWAMAPSATFLSLYLGFFGGFLLYIATADILPEAHSEESSALTLALTLLGTSSAYLVNRLLP